MKLAIFALGISLLLACNNHGANSKTTDSITVNTTESNGADGGPTHGLGDTNKNNRANDTMTHDTLDKK
jgi:hypothetical protein